MSTVRTSAGPIEVHEHGDRDGHPIVLIHGLLVDATIWNAVVGPLAQQGFRVIAPNLPLGAHRTPMDPAADLSPPGLAAIIADVLEALGLEDVTLVANDTGGALAQILITSRPERVGRVVLISCDAFENFLPPAFMPLVKAGGHVPGVVPAIAAVFKVRALQRMPFSLGWLTKRRVADALVAGWATALGAQAIRADTRKVLRAIDKRHTLDAATKLPAFHKPVLLAWAREDRFFPLSDAHRLASLLPDAHVEPVDDAYTFVQLDQPERLAGLIRDFARR